MVVMGGAAAPANYQGPARIEPGEREVVAFIVRPVSGCTWPARPPVRNDRCRPRLCGNAFRPDCHSAIAWTASTWAVFTSFFDAGLTQSRLVGPDRA